jgi:hypothetical protein
MKKFFSTLFALVITLSIFAAPVISLSNNSSSNISDQEIEALVAQSVGVISLEDLEGIDYIFVAVTEDGIIIYEIDGQIFIIYPDK